jgi:hypothetical protein
MANKIRQNSWLKANFLRMLKPLAPTFGISSVERIVDIKVLNNTVLIDIVDTRINPLGVTGGKVIQAKPHSEREVTKSIQVKHPSNLI